MHRPTRQHKHLLEKIARKESLTKRHERKPGKRAKAWNKWVKTYEPLVQGGGAESAA